jgi:transposase
MAVKKKGDVIYFPTYIFKDRNLAVLEAMVDYLVDKGYSYRDIGKILSRDERTIWTVNRRVQHKRHEQ